jgi:hyperosmotically inducible periplasmic protein
MLAECRKGENMLCRTWILSAFIAASTLSVSHAGTAQTKLGQGGGVNTKLSAEVRHQLVMLPYYNVFDNLEYRVENGNTVVLAGQVTRPSLKSDAESVVRRLEGVSKVVNEIEVLPLSPNDDQLRLALYRAIYSKDPLQKYSIRAVSPIHIIVKNGNVTLMGVVLNQADKDMAGMAANSVPGIFSVKNELNIEEKR